MFTGEQFMAHMIGDYIVQNNWMAKNKTYNSTICMIHAALYTLCFIFITQSALALLIILMTHFFIDRFDLACFVVWFKNGCSGPVTKNGFPEGTPAHIGDWVKIIVDNIMHICINALAIYYLG